MILEHIAALNDTFTENLTHYPILQLCKKLGLDSPSKTNITSLTNAIELDKIAFTLNDNIFQNASIVRHYYNNEYGHIFAFEIIEEDAACPNCNSSYTECAALIVNDGILGVTTIGCLESERVYDTSYKQISDTIDLILRYFPNALNVCVLPKY